MSWLSRALGASLTDPQTSKEAEEESSEGHKHPARPGPELDRRSWGAQRVATPGRSPAWSLRAVTQEMWKGEVSDAAELRKEKEKTSGVEKEPAPPPPGRLEGFRRRDPVRHRQASPSCLGAAQNRFPRASVLRH